MDLTMMQKKKHLLLLNRIMRAELKREIIPTPSKLTEEEINDYFNKLFVKKDDYYIPVNNKVSLSIDEELFKGLIKRKKTKEEKMTEKERQKMKEKEMKTNLINVFYKKFENDFVVPYVEKKKAKEDFKKEEQLLIQKYIKLSEDVKKKVKEMLPKMWGGLLNPAFLERGKRKEGLKEEEMKLKEAIKKGKAYQPESKSKPEPKPESKPESKPEPKIGEEEGILNKLNLLEKEFNIIDNKLNEFIKTKKELFAKKYQQIPDKDKPRNQAQAKKVGNKINDELNNLQGELESKLNKIMKELINIKINNNIKLNDDEKSFLEDEEQSTKIFNLSQYKEIIRKEKELKQKRIDEEKEYNRELTRDEIFNKYKDYIFDINKELPNRQSLHLLDQIKNNESILGLVYDNSFVRKDGFKVDGAYIMTKKLIDNNIDLSNPIFKHLLKALKEEYSGDVLYLKKKFNINY
jgi:hypothetical protein